MTNIYLSPSKQPANTYAVGNTNEQVQMEYVAFYTLKALSRYDCNVKLATLAKDPLTGRENGRPAEAEGFKANLYLALHSNATAGGKGTATGFQAYTEPATYAIGTRLVKALKDFYGKPTTASGIFDGLAAFAGQGYAEVREPVKRGVPALLFEIGFHDNPADARWIIDNVEAIGEVIAITLADHFRLKPKAIDPVQPACKVWRVQVGAFIQYENAVRYGDSLRKDKGVDTWIAKEKISGKDTYRVIAGSFVNKANAHRFADKLRIDLKIPVYVYEYLL